MRKTLMVLLLIVTLAVGMSGAVSAEPTTAHIDHVQGSPCDQGQGHPLPHHHLHHHLHHRMNPDNHNGQ